jgi:hypothetical protein
MRGEDTQRGTGIEIASQQSDQEIYTIIAAGPIDMDHCDTGEMTLSFTQQRLMAGS